MTKKNLINCHLNKILVKYKEDENCQQKERLDEKKNICRVFRILKGEMKTIIEEQVIKLQENFEKRALQIKHYAINTTKEHDSIDQRQFEAAASTIE